jgi:hypothetical protein
MPRPLGKKSYSSTPAASGRALVTLLLVLSRPTRQPTTGGIFDHSGGRRLFGLLCAGVRGAPGSGSGSGALRPSSFAPCPLASASAAAYCLGLGARWLGTQGYGLGLGARRPWP